ncbi:CheR family methyltransferase [Azohydromonas lata]|uniref:CheR family methyltransferase n=1 Tax=Azohydromonas lata TaxID=45677 RepID=A0ABU5IPY4_9BURK|nr:CheR family methyltransferase [Azohydromonas lata]MDZ5460937.1 CheR family methyltransferase [Azohydromonas lata]
MPPDEARDDAADTELFDLEVKLLLEAVYLRYQHDFRDYAIASMRRRMRQALQHFQCDSLSQLQHRLLREPPSFQQALRFFTVHVSEMFRDPPYWRALREQVVPLLRTYASLKVWVAGCSSGEEVWSLCVMLAEEALLDRTIVYATDIDPAALRRAETGVFPLERMADFSRNYLAAGGTGSLSDHYTASPHGAAFDRALRRQVVFADHSLATDSVFSEVHLVSCRNVLIYFNRALQDRALGLFREALVRRGFLGLGNRESLSFSAHAEGFEPWCPEQRIYRRRP